MRAPTCRITCDAQYVASFAQSASVHSLAQP
jgi:hypothetical protein